MTRKGEIAKAAHEFYKGDEVSTFVVAAQWADKTILDKACSYLYAKTKMSGTEINKFRKAMEE